MDPHAAELAARALSAMDHRGSDSSGIGGIKQDGSHTMFREPGPAHITYTPAVIARLQTRKISTLIGHNRYATSGPADKHLQPVEAGTGNKQIYFAQNGNLSNLAPLRDYLAGRGIDASLLNDTEMAAHAFAAEVASGATMAQAATTIFPLLVGAHCTVVCGKDGSTPTLAVFRDAYGVRPLVLGKTASGYIVTSETVGLDAAGAEFIREVLPGELIIITHNGLESHQLATPHPRFDLLELIYFSHPNSLFKGVRIATIREARSWQKNLATYTPIH
jgi:amidophosphoribosyltransferase